MPDVPLSGSTAGVTESPVTVEQLATELGNAVSSAMIRALNTAWHIVQLVLVDCGPIPNEDLGYAVMDQAKELYRRGQAPFGVFNVGDIGFVRASPQVLAPSVQNLIDKYRTQWGFA